MNSKTPILIAICFAVSVGPGRAADVDVSKLPPPSAATISFDADIKPIFEGSCFRCHGPEKPKSGFRLDQRDAALKGGDNGVAIIPGESVKSPLIHFVARLVEDMEMPPADKGEPLTPEKIGVLRAWIDQGAKWSESGALERPNTVFTVTPSVRWITVDGNAARFREQWWMQDGVAGGVEEFLWQEKLGEKTKLTLEGSGLYGGDDFGVKLNLEREELGFVRAGYTQFRSYSDDSGGFYAPFGVAPFELGRDLYLDHGRAWLDLGLTLPNWPRIVVGYEYLFRDGEKSTLQWGGVNDADFNTRAIFPAYKQIDEQIHIIKLDVSHEIQGVLMEDNFRAEFYDLRTRRSNVDSYSLGQTLPDAMTTHDENYDHFNAMNTLRAEKQLREWLFVSGGYLYSHLDGAGGFNQETVVPLDPSLPPFAGDLAQQIVLSQESHIVNANTMLGPWEGLIVTAGLQSEWTHQDGLGQALLFGLTPSQYGSDMDRAIVEENFAVRYNRIPFTVLYAEAQFRQESYDHYEQQVVGDALGFLRDTDATGDLKEYRAGFTVSPWTAVALQAGFKHRLKQNDYDALADADRSRFPGNGYPAFIRSRDIKGDEFEAKLIVRPISWLKATLKYQLSATDYRTVTDSGVSPVRPNPPFPGGGSLAGNYDTHTYSISAVFTPWRRLYLSGAFSYTDTRMETSVTDGALVVPYQGEIHSVLAGAQYVLSQTLDLNANYSFSRADYRQANEAGGLPLGIEYDRHGVVAGITKRWPKNITSRLQYGFYSYHDPAAGGFDDYTAHGLFASISVALP